MKIFPVLSLLAALVLAGCGTPTESKQPILIAGGKIIGITFGPGGPVAGKADGYEVKQAISTPVVDTKSLIYKFAFSAPAGVKLAHVVVDDISDEQSSPMLDDPKPWLDENNEWRAETRPYDYKDPMLAWAYTVTPSMRVYRFTITDSNGRKTVLYQATPYPPFVKGAMRFQWGEKY